MPEKRKANIIIIIIIIIITPDLANGLSQDSESQQVSLSFKDSSQYFDRS